MCCIFTIFQSFEDIIVIKVLKRQISRLFGNKLIVKSVFCTKTDILQQKSVQQPSCARCWAVTNGEKKWNTTFCTQFLVFHFFSVSCRPTLAQEGCCTLFHCTKSALFLHTCLHTQKVLLHTPIWHQSDQNYCDHTKGWHVACKGKKCQKGVHFKIHV